jgi:hypothetical protein
VYFVQESCRCLCALFVRRFNPTPAPHRDWARQKYFVLYDFTVEDNDNMIGFFGWSTLLLALYLYYTHWVLTCQAHKVAEIGSVRYCIVWYIIVWNTFNVSDFIWMISRGLGRIYWLITAVFLNYLGDISSLNDVLDTFSIRWIFYCTLLWFDGKHLDDIVLKRYCHCTVECTAMSIQS